MKLVALLRGINVAGHRKLPMADLRELFTDVGCTDVRTYIASGNVVCEADMKPAELGQLVAERIAADFGYDVPTVVLSAAEFAQIVGASPFTPETGPEPKNIGVAFAHADSPVDPGEPDRFSPDQFVVGDRAVYTHYPNGQARTKMDNGTLERLTGATLTTRNWNTCQKLLTML